MKFVVTGAAGHVSKPLTELLLKKGHDVTVVGRCPKNLEGLVKLGAKTAVGDLGDVPFLTETFKGTDGVYLMLPPMWDSDDQKKQSIRYAENFSSAIRANGVKNAVFLSSYGAHRLDDAGAISGLGLAEVVLNKLDGVNVLSLRAGYFYTNLLLSLDLVKTAGHMGNMFTIPDGTFTVVDPGDTARVAAEALDKLNFKGHSHVYVISNLSGTDEIASLIGMEIGIPDLKWVKFPAKDFKNVLLNYGFADGAANDYVEMFATLDTGFLFEDIQKTKPKIEGTSIEEFAKTWAAAYRLRKGSAMSDQLLSALNTIKIPGPDHPITIEHNPNRVVVTVAGRVVADTRDALILREASYPAVHYVPCNDVDMALLERTEHATYCPYKGDCSYFSIPLGGDRSVNAVWTYEAPYAAVTLIKDHLAFYPDRVDAIEERHGE